MIKERNTITLEISGLVLALLTKIAVSSKIITKGKEKISIPLSLSFLRRMTEEMLWLFHFCDEIVNGDNNDDYFAFDVKRRNKF